MTYRFPTLLGIIACASLTACAGGPSYEFMQVNANFSATAQPQEPPEITATEGYRQFAGQAQAVALRAPDNCANSTANQVSGSASSQGAVLGTDCGVRMAEIERALTRAGYRVISWSVLQRELARPGASAIEVANNLGAQVLFQVNSLESGRKTLGKDARWDRQYRKSDKTGKDKGPWELDEPSRVQIRGNMALSDREKKENEKFRPVQVTLDASAVWAPTGQSLWYYRWTRAADPVDTGTSFSLLLACPKGLFDQCQSVNPELQSNTKSAVKTKAAGESVAVSSSEKSEDADSALRSQLTTEVINNFVGSFSEARKFAVSQAQ